MKQTCFSPPSLSKQTLECLLWAIAELGPETEVWTRQTCCSRGIKSAAESQLSVLVSCDSQAHTLHLLSPCRVILIFIYHILNTYELYGIYFNIGCLSTKVLPKKKKKKFLWENNRVWLNFPNLNGKLYCMYPEFYSWVYFSDWSISSAERQNNILMDQ